MRIIENSTCMSQFATWGFNKEAIKLMRRRNETVFGFLSVSYIDFIGVLLQPQIEIGRNKITKWVSCPCANLQSFVHPRFDKIL